MVVCSYPCSHTQVQIFVLHLSGPLSTTFPFLGRIDVSRFVHRSRQSLLSLALCVWGSAATWKELLQHKMYSHWLWIFHCFYLPNTCISPLGEPSGNKPVMNAGYYYGACRPQFWYKAACKCAFILVHCHDVNDRKLSDQTESFTTQLNWHRLAPLKRPDLCG